MRTHRRRRCPWPWPKRGPTGREAWQPNLAKHPKTLGYCSAKGAKAFNHAQFPTHLLSTLAVVLLPVLLIARVPTARRTGELAFALSSLAFGLVSVIASSLSYAAMQWMNGSSLTGGARHATVITALLDQNGIFLGACLNVIRVWKKHDDRENADVEVDTKGLVIQVERRWSVHVEIVDSWGHGWRDPWEHGSVNTVNTYELEDTQDAVI